MAAPAPQLIRTATPQSPTGRIQSVYGAALIAIGATALAVVAPAFFLGNASGHDFDFHISSWMDASRQWSQGVIYPRWAAWANYGFGEPRFIFYPPISWLLGAALGHILPWRVVPGAFLWLALALAGWSMYRLAREWLAPADATWAALLYAANPYHLVVVYLRSDFAELLASALFPLLVLFAVRGSLWLAPVFAAIWLANAPAGVIATYSVVLLFVALAVLRRSVLPLWTGARAMAVGFLLAGFYLVPAAYEQRWVNIGEALSAGLRPEQNFLFTWINDPEHNFFNLIVSTAATSVIVLAGLAAVVSNRREPRNRELWCVLVGLWAAAVILMLPVTLPLWRRLPELRFLQFPWRWAIVAGVAFAYFLAAGTGAAPARKVWRVALLAFLMAGGAILVHFGWWDSEDVPAMRAAIDRDTGYEGTDEYNVRGADHYDLPLRAPRVALLAANTPSPLQPVDSRAHAQIEDWRAEEKLFAVDAPGPVLAAPRLLHYPAWQVEVNGRLVHARGNEDTGQLLIPLPAGHNLVRVRLVRTPDRVVGGVLSLLAAAGWLALARLERRRGAQVRS